MSLNITREVADMKRLTTGELKDKYESVCGCPPRSHNRDWLVKKIIWRMQAIEEGGLPERARRRALEMADDADLRKRPPRSFTEQVESAEETTVAPDPGRDRRLPPSGTVLVRIYKRQTITVTVNQDDFNFNGKRYETLSAIANEVTGSHVNGFAFFKLNPKKGAAK